ncbi:HpcH/HpaI aldolase/citrate lyase family protein [Microbacterium sp.]|uniref:HpcH/HpaI aldolase/citrate lyase family protein n=1 Tax=Microbacterium sp. TaxID=51671 RepID=UPI003C717808
MTVSSVFSPTLYTPATTPVSKQLALVNGWHADVRRVVLCTEDAIAETDIPLAIDNLRVVLAGAERDTGTTTYVRARNVDVLRQILDVPGVEKLRGFVIPKADPESLSHYIDLLQGTDFTVMPILESHRMFDWSYRTALLHATLAYSSHIECLRIGGNDLLGYLGIRRPTARFTIYDTPIGGLIGEIIREFRGVGGFTVTAPVFECYGPAYDDLLRAEVSRHIMNGLFGQTVIHPRHLRLIEDMYRVSSDDLESALSLKGATTAITGLNDRMDEHTTHWRWADTVLERYRVFGDDQQPAAVVGL